MEPTKRTAATKMLMAATVTAMDCSLNRPIRWRPSRESSSCPHVSLSYYINGMSDRESVYSHLGWPVMSQKAGQVIGLVCVEADKILGVIQESFGQPAECRVWLLEPVSVCIQHAVIGTLQLRYLVL